MADGKRDDALDLIDRRIAGLIRSSFRQHSRPESSDEFLDTSLMNEVLGWMKELTVSYREVMDEIISPSIITSCRNNQPSADESHSKYILTPSQDAESQVDESMRRGEFWKDMKDLRDLHATDRRNLEYSDFVYHNIMHSLFDAFREEDALKYQAILHLDDQNDRQKELIDLLEQQLLRAKGELSAMEVVQRKHIIDGTKSPTLRTASRGTTTCSEVVIHDDLIEEMRSSSEKYNIFLLRENRKLKERVSRLERPVSGKRTAVHPSP